MATIIKRKVNPYQELAAQVVAGFGFVGTSISGSPTLDQFVGYMSDFLNNIEYASSNRFDLNKVETYGLCAMAMNEVENPIDLDRFDSNVVSNLLSSSYYKSISKITKNDIDVCRGCEFRDVCMDCRAFHGDDLSLLKPAKCTYDPHTGLW